MAKVSITEPWLSRAAADGDKPAKLPDGVAQERYWDNALPGFGIVIGRRFATFVVKHRVQGRQVLATIGRWGHPGAGEDHSETWTVARARKEAIRLLGSMEQGVQPVAKRASSDALTLRHAFEAHVDVLRKAAKAGKRSEATIATFEKSMRYVESWLDRPIAELTGAELRSLYERIKREARPRANAKNERGVALARRVITNIGTAWATLNRLEEGKLGNWNPAKSVTRDALVERRTVVADVADWYARVQTMRNPIQRDGLMFALFTGLRSEDVRTVRHEYVDVEAKTLHLPDPKGGEARAFTIPLPATCIEILERRERDNPGDLGRVDGDHGWAFPGVDGAGTVGPIADLRQQVHKQVAGPDDELVEQHTRFPVESVHDLRRTYETTAHEAGISELDIHVLTNHAYASHNVNATYIRQHIDHLARCQATIEAALKQKLKPAPKPTHKLKARGHLAVVA